MAEHPDFQAAQGAFAFVMAEMDADEIRATAKLVTALEESEGWHVLTRFLSEKREAILAELETVAPESATAVFARQAALAQALRWPVHLPAVIRDFARRKDEADKQALQAATAARRE